MYIINKKILLNFSEKKTNKNQQRQVVNARVNA